MNFKIFLASARVWLGQTSTKTGLIALATGVAMLLAGVPLATVLASALPTAVFGMFVSDKGEASTLASVLPALATRAKPTVIEAFLAAALGMSLSACSGALAGLAVLSTDVSAASTAFLAAKAVVGIAEGIAQEAVRSDPSLETTVQKIEIQINADVTKAQSLLTAGTATVRQVNTISTDAVALENATAQAVMVIPSAAKPARATSIEP